VIKRITKSFQAQLEASTKIFKSSEFFVNGVIFVEKPVAALLLNVDIVAGNSARQ